jgi:hypothetical protein
MKKDTLERFVNKYHLNGINDSAVWIIKNGTLQVKVMTTGKKLLADVTWKNFYGFDDVEVGILTSKRLLGLLKTIPSANVSMDIVKRASGDIAAVGFIAAKYKTQYVTSSLSDLDPVPSMNKLPPFTAAVIMDEEFTDWFKSANAAMSDCEALFTIVMSQQTGKLEVVMGYRAESYSDRLYFQPSTVVNMDVVKAPLSFTARYLKEVLKANSEFKDPVLNISDAGLASISFSEDDLDSQYYLVQIDVED